MRSRRLSRRHVLRGLGLTGISLALPALDLMRPARADSPSSPKRLFFFVWPNGCDLRDWTPASEGTNWSLTPALQSLAPHRDDINVLSGLANKDAADVVTSNSNPHARAFCTFLTCVPMSTKSGAGGISVDEVAAAHLSGATAFSKLTLAIKARKSVDEGRFSWLGESAPVTPETDPQVVFDKLFSNASLDPNAAAKALERKKSIIDFVKSDLDDLKAQLGKTDQERLEQHFNAIRELETSIEKLNTIQCSAPSDPGSLANDDSELEKRCQALLDLAVMAFRCDLTRVIAFSLGSTASSQTYPFMGVGTGDHEISHMDMSSDANRQLYTKITEWKISQFASALDRLKVADPSGARLLDDCITVCASEMSGGGGHQTELLPVIVAGGGMQTGRHIIFPCRSGASGGPYNKPKYCTASSNTRLSNLWLTMLQAGGVPATSFGDSTGTLNGLWLG